MILRTAIRDCLLLSWALPLDGLPSLPAPLRYEVRDTKGDARVFALALLFFHEGFRLAALPILRFSYPQFCMALAVLDGTGSPCLFFTRVLLPVWLGPAARLVATPPVATAQLHFDRPSEQPGQGHWKWSVGRDSHLLAVEAQPGTPSHSSFFSCWDDAVQAFRQRRRGYYQTDKGLRFLETRLPPGEAWPLNAEISQDSLLSFCLPLGAGKAAAPQPWPELHSAMLFPELRLDFERSLTPQVELASRQVPQPAPSRRCAL